MMEKGKITAFQMAVMMYPTIIATAILVIPRIDAEYSGKDAWIAPIWAAPVGVYLVYILYWLNRLYPNESLIQYSERIIGKIAGKLLGLIYIFAYFINDGIILREYGEFVTGAFLQHTPVIIVMGSMILVCAYAIHGGLKTLAFCAQIFVPIVIVLILLIMFLVIPDLDPHHLIPMFENGITPSLMAAIPTHTWFSEFVDVSFLLPFVVNRKDSFRLGMLSVLAVMISMVVSNLVALLLLGDLTSEVSYPIMLVARYISLADFLTHLESVAMAIWVLAMFIKICVVYYVLVLMVSQWLKLPDYHPIVLPLAFALLPFSLWIAPNLHTLAVMLSTSYVFFYIFIQVFIPTVIFAAAFIRARFQKQNKPGGSAVPRASSEEG
ncbi:endospore germination permease [Paenibacillus sp. NPDC056579]|uniref:GerAB/ArcD/ProY family transporter n=1 Tax=unclassified Paenibacillus TaxID=185978 RepID=UPI001EF92EA4|nr:endospore germination permease [Paenibacillus sp. H1-7]